MSATASLPPLCGRSSKPTASSVGLAVGTFFGWASARALRSEGIGHFTFPLSNIVVITVIACVAGAVAAIVPARRAARLDILTAIATDQPGADAARPTSHLAASASRSRLCGGPHPGTPIPTARPS